MVEENYTALGSRFVIKTDNVATSYFLTQKRARVRSRCSFSCCLRSIAPSTLRSSLRPSCGNFFEGLCVNGVHSVAYSRTIHPGRESSKKLSAVVKGKQPVVAVRE